MPAKDSFTGTRKISSGTPIGWAGITQTAPRVYEDTGICLGPGYVGRGLGKQIVRAQSLGFTLIGSKPKTDARNGYPYNVLEYSLKL